MGKLLSIRLIQLLVTLYDIITLPVYYIIQRPWIVRKEATRSRARQIEPFVWVNFDSKLDKSDKRSIDTLDQLFRDSVSTYANNNALGVRKILAIEYKSSTSNNPSDETSKGEQQQTRKVISKYVLDDKYTWYTYRQINDIVIKLSAGLTSFCSQSIVNQVGSRKLLICADTCMPWFLIAHACFRNNITVATAYTTLADDAIEHIINQTEVRVIVVSQKVARRLPAIIKQSSLIDTVILLDGPLPGEADEIINLKSFLLGSTKVHCIISYNDLLTRGEEVDENIESPPKGNDIAVLMYTSGSTGQAKGVILSHSGIVYTALAFSGPGDISHEDRYIGYLPLGHVLELAAECIFLRNGSTIAYSSPFTLTTTSAFIKYGQKGDAVIFKPTIMGAVPLVLDRIRSGIQSTVKAQGPFYDQLINDFVVKYKRYWWERYYETPIMNFLICNKFNKILGGEIRAICSGGAALSRETQEYLRHVTNYTVLQGYGLTETSAAASFCNITDRRYNVVGPPYPNVRVKLESWSDYSTDDKPNPRGEILIGGQPVALGYYKNEELTKESFFVNPKDGLRYFRTGDIGTMLPDGCLKIIDRKKDIVKPLSGEYISLSEIEVTLQTCPLVENICVHCSQYSNYVVALVRPNEKELRLLAKQLFNEETETGREFVKSMQKAVSTVNNSGTLPPGLQKDTIVEKVAHSTLCLSKLLTQRALTTIQKVGSSRGLKKTQIPSRLKLVSEEWTPESGLATASFKLKRRDIERHHAEDIKQLYAELGQKID